MAKKKIDKPFFSNKKIILIFFLIFIFLFLIPLYFMFSKPLEVKVLEVRFNVSDTLGIGIFTTLFSVYFIARLLTSMYVIKNKHKENLI